MLLTFRLKIRRFLGWRFDHCLDVCPKGHSFKSRK